MFDGFLFCKIQSEFLLDLFVYIAVFDIWNVGVYHQGDQVQDKVCAFTQDGECCEAKVLETCVVLRLRSSHAINHLLADFDRWWEGFGISAEDVAEVHWMSISQFSNTKAYL